MKEFFVKFCKCFFATLRADRAAAVAANGSSGPLLWAEGEGASVAACLLGHVLRGPDSPGSHQDEWALCCHPSSSTQAWVGVCACTHVCVCSTFFVLQRCVLAAATPRLTLASKQPNQTELVTQKQIAVRRPFTGLSRAFRERNVAPIPIRP